jgi:hypothetical protein
MQDHQTLEIIGLVALTALIRVALRIVAAAIRARKLRNARS